MLWHIGNTTVRTPYRLRDALRAIYGTSFNGSIIGKKREHEFAAHLHTQGVLNSPDVEKGNDASSLGRKWRSALSQLGFITPSLTRGGLESGVIDPALSPFVEGIENLSGRPFEITPNGKRLMESDLLPAQQECFLRSLATYRIPSVLEDKYRTEPFSPLRFILNIFENIENSGEQGKLSFQEFALFVQTASPADGSKTIAENILKFRNDRTNATGRIPAFDRAYYSEVSNQVGKQASTLKDYADLTFRYLKATGLFKNSGRGIVQSSAKDQLAALLLSEPVNAISNQDYLHALWQGAELPTDNAENAAIVVTDLATKLRERGIEVEPIAVGAEIRDLEHIRFGLEAEISQLDEQEYAEAQADNLDEILAWMEAIPTRGSAKLPNGDTVKIPQGEGPAYLEWIIWRAFLAINSLIKPAWEARRFQIDQDFLPVHHAPSGGPDMIFEFDDAIIVVEVTLTASSRQEAAEGEPVRRHVAKIAEETDKRVYGLFIAIQIDSNTAHTFRSGDWYKADDSKMALQIVPITLSDFKNLLKSGEGLLDQMPSILQQALLECRASANEDAPAWKRSIATIIREASTLPS